MGGVADLQIAYLDLSNPSLGPSWQAQWRKPGLPPLVRLRVASRQSSGEPTREIWPTLLVRLPLAKDPRRGGGRFAAAGGRP